jgi:hypothetical protein
MRFGSIVPSATTPPHYDTVNDTCSRPDGERTPVGSPASAIACRPRSITSPRMVLGEEPATRPSAPSSDDRQLCTTVTHPVSRFLDTPRACTVPSHGNRGENRPVGLTSFKTGAVNRLATSPHNRTGRLERISGRMDPATLAGYPANPAGGPETPKDLCRPISWKRGEVLSNVAHQVHVI